MSAGRRRGIGRSRALEIGEGAEPAARRRGYAWTLDAPQALSGAMQRASDHPLSPIHGPICVLRGGRAGIQQTFSQGGAQPQILGSAAVISEARPVALRVKRSMVRAVTRITHGSRVRRQLPAYQTRQSAHARKSGASLLTLPATPRLTRRSDGAGAQSWPASSRTPQRRRLPRQPSAAGSQASQLVQVAAPNQDRAGFGMAADT